MAMEAKQRAKETRGRVRITIPPLDGMPLLTMDDVRAIAAARFIDATPPFRPPVKLNGVMVEDVGTLDWAFFAKPPNNHQSGWHIRLPHPSNNPNHWYHYYLQSDYAKHHSLCHTCHQHKPSVCKVKGKGCRELQVRNQVKEGHRANLAMPSRTSISFAQISSADPNIYSVLESMQQHNNSRRR